MRALSAPCIDKGARAPGSGRRVALGTAARHPRHVRGSDETERPGVRVQLLGGFAAWVDGRRVPDERWRLRRARDLVALLALAPSHRMHREEAIELLWPAGSTSSPLNSLHQVIHVARHALEGDGGGARRFILLTDEVLALADEGQAVRVDAVELESAVRDARRELTAEARARVAALHCGELLPDRRYEEWAAGRRDEIEVAVSEVLDGRAGPAAGSSDRVDPGAASAAEGTLPAFLDSFIGRDRELVELGDLLRQNRLLTLCGPGGVGKTRLACELARRADADVEGPWFVDLAAISQTSLVLTAVAETIGVRPRSGESLLSAVTGRLGHGRSLLVLDNCEHLLAACAEYAETLLKACPALTVLATSREPLRVAGEKIWRTPSLNLPQDDASAADLDAYEAIRLLVDRTQAVDPSFRVDAGNADDVAHLCRRLDGLPLAIELAAARLGALTPRQLADRLDARFHLLNAGSRTALTRQQTLEATLDWSHELLDERQRAVFRRLSVFAGGFDLSAAESVCAGEAVAPRDVAAVVAELAEKSLVGVESLAGGRRHRLLETIREYARERLAAAGELEATARRHAEWCAGLAERAEPELSKQQEAEWLRTLERESDNLRAALVWTLDRDTELVARLAAALGRFWLRRLRLSEGVSWVDAALERAGASTLLRARLTYARSSLEMRRMGETLAMVSSLEEAARIAGAAGDTILQAKCLMLLGAHGVIFELSETTSDGAFQQALDLGRAHRLPAVEAAVAACLGIVHAYRGEDDDAERWLRDALARFRRLEAAPDAERLVVPGGITLGEVLGPRRELGGRVRSVLEQTFAPLRELSVAQAVAHVTGQLGVLARLRGDVDRATALLLEAYELYRSLEDRHGMGESLSMAGNLALVAGELDTARQRTSAAMRIHRQIGDARAEGLAINALGCIALSGGDGDEAVRLYDSAIVHFTRAGDRPALRSSQLHRADAALVTGDLETAAGSYRAMGAGLSRYGAWIDFCLADVAEAAGDREGARRLLSGTRADLARHHGLRAAAACDARLADLAGERRAGGEAGLPGAGEAEVDGARAGIGPA